MKLVEGAGFVVHDFMIIVFLLPVTVISFMYTEFVILTDIVELRTRPLTRFGVSFLLSLIFQYILVMIGQSAIGSACFYIFSMPMTNYYINRKLSLATSVATPFLYFLYYYANGLSDFAIANFHLIVTITCIITAGHFVLDMLLELGGINEFLRYTIIAVVVNVMGIWLYGYFMIQTITNDYILYITIGTLLMQFLVTTYLSVKEKQARDFERARYNEEHDALTGLYNYEAYGKEIKRLSGSNQDFNVVMFDIDHFKQINDTYGHLEGNGVLQYFGNCLQDFTHTKIDKSALVYRFGGEEFCVIMPKMSSEKVRKYFINFQNELKEAKYRTEDGRQVELSFSGGIASTGGSTGISSAMQRADNALYRAKNLGRSRIEVSS